MVDLVVPQRVVARYFVPAATVVNDPAALVAGLVNGLDGFVGDVARDRFAKRLAAVATVTPDQLPFAPLLSGADPAHAAAWSDAAQLIEIAAVGRPGIPWHEWGTRGAAIALADHLGSPVLDVFWLRNPDFLRNSIAGPRDGLASLHRWITVVYSLDAGVARVTTAGLYRYGLPELQSEGVPAQLASRWADVVAAVAESLFQFWILPPEGAGAGDPGVIRERPVIPRQ